MPKKIIIFAAIALLFCSCGTTTDGEGFDPTVTSQVEPYITRIAPAAGTAGDTITIFGIGFSNALAFNVIIINGEEIFANGHTFLNPPSGDEFESLTFTIPAGMTLGVHSVFLDVLDNPSNTNVTITIN